MSQSQDKPLIEDDAIEVFRQHIAAKIAKAAAAGKGSAESLPPSAPALFGHSAPSKKRAVEGSSGLASDKNVISFDHSASAYSKYGSLEGKVHGVLLPRDKKKYQELGTDATGRLGVQCAFQSMQTLIFMTDKVGEVEEQVKKSKEVEKMLHVEIKDLTSSKAETDALIVELQEQLTRQDVDFGRLHTALADVESLKLKLADSGMTIAMAAKRAEIKTKAKMVHDWENNKTDTWDIQKIYADAEELEKLKAMDPDQTAAALDKIGAP